MSRTVSPERLAVFITTTLLATLNPALGIAIGSLLAWQLLTDDQSLLGSRVGGV